MHLGRKKIKFLFFSRLVEIIWLCQILLLHLQSKKAFIHPKTQDDMKKRLTMTILVMTIALAGHAQLVKFGLTAGGNINQMKLDKEVINEENFTGFFEGATIDIGLPLPGLSAEGSVLYDRRSVNVLGEDDHIDYIDVPLNAKYSIGLGSLGSIYGATGPQFSFNIGDDNIFNHKYELKSSAFSWNIGAGIKILKHIQLGYRYNIPISDTAETIEIKESFEEVKKGVKDKSGTHHIFLTYYF